MTLLFGVCAAVALAVCERTWTDGGRRAGGCFHFCVANSATNTRKVSTRYTRGNHGSLPSAAPYVDGWAGWDACRSLALAPSSGRLISSPFANASRSSGDKSCIRMDCEGPRTETWKGSAHTHTHTHTHTHSYIQGFVLRVHAEEVWDEADDDAIDENAGGDDESEGAC